jgi:hypothetical protein
MTHQVHAYHIVNPSPWPLTRALPALLITSDLFCTVVLFEQLGCGDPGMCLLVLRAITIGIRLVSWWVVLVLRGMRVKVESYSFWFLEFQFDFFLGFLYLYWIPISCTVLYCLPYLIDMPILRILYSLIKNNQHPLFSIFRKIREEKLYFMN